MKKKELELLLENYEQLQHCYEKLFESSKQLLRELDHPVRDPIMIKTCRNHLELMLISRWREITPDYGRI